MATILGLLLIVTFIANYISTTLPNQMGQNDLQHNVMVENQVSQLSALLEATAQTGEVGLQVTQPVTLGSAGAFPFATQDSSTITPIANGSGLSVNFTLVGPIWVPTGGIANTGRATGCTATPSTLPTQITCASSSKVFWNFSAGSHTPYGFTQTGSGAVQVNFSTNNSLIAVGTTNNAVNSVEVIGSHDTVYANTTLASASVSFLLVGSNDTVIIRTGATPAIAISVVGDYDSISTTTTGGGSVFLRAYGGHDIFTDSGTAATVYYIGFNLENPSSGSCPYGNAANSDTVAGAIGGTVHYNNTNSASTNHTTGNWVYKYLNPSPSACPYVVSASVAQTPTATGFVVALRNTYSPYAEVAFDEGAVVIAQSGSIPVFLVPPTIGFANGALQLFVPQFANRVGSEAGIGTAALSLRLLSTPQVTIPGQSFAFANNTPVALKIISPYATAWAAYFLSVPALATYLSCAYPTYPHPVSISCSTLANTFYEPGGPLGTVTLSVPTTGLQLQYLVGLYSANLE